MTQDLLDRANALNQRILLLNELIESAKDKPITMQSGMGKLAQFDVFDNEELAQLSNVQKLDNELHARIIELLTSYRNRLNDFFDGLGEA